MTISEIQNHASKLCEKQGWTDKTEGKRFCHLISEVGELSRELYRSKRNIKKIAYEMSDVIWNICELANKLSINLDPYIEEKLDADMRRKW